ncbi:MAG: Non-specific protein-tyrosine kinase [Proteobacteria bacterium]|nr:Non-specific protein-tyrosine kinase [Pseudomonadota bacterium]
MSLIEQATQRLEQLRQAGVDLPPAPTPEAPSAVVSARPVTPVRALEPVFAPSAGAAAAQRVELDPKVLSAAGIVHPDAMRSQLGDEYRVIKRPLIDNAKGRTGAVPIKDANLIMITSALPGEGKTFTAANLAMSIAMELNHTVMLVDADVARPSLMKLLGLPQRRGLLDVLGDESVDLQQVLLRTNIANLTILPSGNSHPRATELLASDAMVRLLADMGSRYADRIIIFDSPPLLVTTEARALAAHMGQVVVVVKAESTSQAEVKHALAMIAGCPIKLMLLNQAATSVKDGYGYGYGYGYGN